MNLTFVPNALEKISPTWVISIAPTIPTFIKFPMLPII